MTVKITEVKQVKDLKKDHKTYSKGFVIKRNYPEKDVEAHFSILSF